MNYRNARFLADGRIDCEVDHPKFGWIEYTAHADDVVELSRALHAEIVASGSAAPHAPDPAAELEAWRRRATCTPLQGRLALGEAYWTEVEAILADAATPWAMKQMVTSSQVWRRNSHEIDSLAWMLNLEPEEVDDLFRLAATLT